MNLDYDTSCLDKQKLKIDKMFQEITNIIVDKKTEIKILAPKKWNEAFLDVIQTISSVDVLKKKEMQHNIKKIKFNRKLS
jgi:hypothetical protein